MSNALAWIRKSKGDDDAIGLQQQRQQVATLAAELADDVTSLDLGIQTGFSSLTRDGDGLLDDHADVEAELSNLRAGEYDYLVAYDDTRICRDGFFEVIRHACEAGDTTIAYVADVETDALAHDIKRRVERDTKEDEIEKSRQAIQERQERGFDHGRPKFGMEYDDAGQYQVPGEDFDLVVDILEKRADGASYSEIAGATGVSRSTVHKVVNRRQWYEARAGSKLDTEVVES